MRHTVRLVCWDLAAADAAAVAGRAGGELVDPGDGGLVAVDLAVDARTGPAAVRKARKALDDAARKARVDLGAVTPIII